MSEYKTLMNSTTCKVNIHLNYGVKRSNHAGITPNICIQYEYPARVSSTSIQYKYPVPESSMRVPSVYVSGACVLL